MKLLLSLLDGFIGGAWIRGVRMALVYFGICVIAFADGNLAGEYRRSEGIENRMQLTLNSDGTFKSKAEGMIGKSFHEIYVGNTGENSGTWKQIGNEVRLTLSKTSDKTEHGTATFQIVDWDGQPALLSKEDRERKAIWSFPFDFLLLKERPFQKPATMKDEEVAAAAKLEWKVVETALHEQNVAEIKRFAGKFVVFEGDRANWGDYKSLEIEVGRSSSAIHCRVRNNIDGTRLAEFWMSGMARILVEGTILSIDTASKTVEIQPANAALISAR